MRGSNNLENKIPLDILKSSADMYENSGSNFFRITTGMQLGLNAPDKLWLDMIFLTNFGITEIYAVYMKYGE